MDKVFEDFKKWLDQQPGKTETPTGPFQEEQFRNDFEAKFGKPPSNDLVERTRRFYEDRVKERKSVASAQKHGVIPEETMTATTGSAPNVLAMEKSQVAEGGSGPPRPGHFGVTAEHVAAYRPSDPYGHRSFGFFLYTMLCFGLPILVFINAVFDWQGSVVFVVGAFVFWCMLRLSRYDSASRELRGRIESYLRAKAEYETAVRQAELEQRRRKEDYWLNLSGLDFEKEMARLYEADGYSVETTPVTGDEGADLLLRKDGELIVVQCKRQDKPVGPHIVRDLYGTLYHFGANRAFLDSPSGFTEGVRRYACGKPIELHDLDYTLSFQERLSRKPEQPE